MLRVADWVFRIVPDLTNWVFDVLESLGYGGLIVLIFLEGVFPPIPSEIILPLAGFMAADGRFSLPLLILAATAGSVLSAIPLYAIGHRLGAERVRRLVGSYGRYVMLGIDDVDRARQWFERHGNAAVLFGRLAPVIRSLISIPAGIEAMPRGRFLIYTAIGSAIWNTVLIGLGWVLGDQWEKVGDYVAYLQYLVLIAAVVLIGRFVIGRLRANRSSATP